MCHQLCKLLALFALIATAVSSPIQASRTLASAPETQDDDALSPSPLYYAPSPYEDDLSPEPQYPYEEEEEEDDMAPIYPPLAYAPGPDIEDEYPYDEEEDMAPVYPPLAFAPGPEIDEDYAYDDAENPSLSPAPAPYLDLLAPDADDYIDDDDELDYSPSEAPTPTSTPTATGVSDSDTPVTPQMQGHAPPPVSVYKLPLNYSAEDNTGDQFSNSEEDEEEGYPEENKKKNNGSVIGFVMGAVCLVGFGGLMYKKHKSKKRKHPLYVQLSKKDEV